MFDLLLNSSLIKMTSSFVTGTFATIYAHSVLFKLLCVSIFVIWFLYAFYGLYILVMGVYRAHLQKKLTRLNYVLCFPWVLVGYLFDVFANVVIMPFIFLELPRETLVTTRLKRHLRTPVDDRDWRYDLASLVCTKLLDIFDPYNAHCATVTPNFKA